jgi:hypothetical protein
MYWGCDSEAVRWPGVVGGGQHPHGRWLRWLEEALKGRRADKGVRVSEPKVGEMVVERPSGCGKALEQDTRHMRIGGCWQPIVSMDCQHTYVS